MAKLSMSRPAEGKNNAAETQESLDKQRQMLLTGAAETKVRISVDVSRSTHEKLRLYAWSRRKSMNKIINETIEELLKEQ